MDQLIDGIILFVGIVTIWIVTRLDALKREQEIRDLHAQADAAMDRFDRECDDVLNWFKSRHNGC